MTAKELRKADLRETANELQWLSRPMEDSEVRAILINLCEKVAELEAKQSPFIAYRATDGIF